MWTYIVVVVWGLSVELLSEFREIREIREISRNFAKNPLNEFREISFRNLRFREI